MKKILSCFILIVLILLPLMVAGPKLSAADLFNPACTNKKESSTDNSSQSSVCQQTKDKRATTENPISGPDGIIQKAANIFALVTVVAGTILIVYSGFVFVTAGGTRAGDNASRARSARMHLTSALAGIAIVALAWLIVTFVNTRIIHS